jgi:hypothetical protein
MNKIYLSFFCVLNLLLISVNNLFGQTTWYVNQTANGANNGTSISNAWKSFSAINWTNIGNDGSTDSILISPGIYNETLNIPPNKSNIIIAGNNGNAVIDGQSTRDDGINLSGGAYTNIKIYGITVKNALSRLINITNASNYSPIKNVVVEACSLYNYRSYGIFVEADGGGSEDASNVTIKNNYLNDDDSFKGQSDGIYIQYLDSARVSGNTVINDNPTDPGGVNVDWHSDNLQTYEVNSVLVDNNYFYQGNNYKGVGTQVIFTAEVFDRPGIHVYYNNLIIRNVPNAYDAAIRTKGNDGKIVYILNNTFFGYGRVQEADCGGYLENNIFSVYPGYKWDSYSSFGTPVTRLNNLVYDPDNAFSPMPGSIADNPQFVNDSFNSFDGRLRSGSFAIHTGKDLKSLVESFGLEWTDINGTARSSTPDIGAYSSYNSVADISTANSKPNSFILTQNYPNPFNPSTNINYTVPAGSNILIRVFDLTGKEIKTLVNEFKQAGTYSISFNAAGLPSGVYFYSLIAGNFIDTKKMVLLK